MSPDIYDRFGAEVKYDQAGEGLFLITSRRIDPAPKIRAYGGEVVMRFNHTKVLARIHLNRVLELLREPGISKAGGVHLDLERYRKFLEARGISQLPSGESQPRS